MTEKDALLERAAKAVAEAAGDGCFDRIAANDCGCDGDCVDHEGAAHYRSLARAALVSANILPRADAERCHHCGSLPDPDGDHSCPCPLSDSECLEHTLNPVLPRTDCNWTRCRSPQAGKCFAWCKCRCHAIPPKATDA